ncbi:rCG39071 [Rattus norvegicus]|uniref:RCG39071 n=1 Tax=Rattus norvegicus TaxID=10116 RepID=A6JXY3_RAT|nr:rCG39071 [Rattus norvegicus]
MDGPVSSLENTMHKKYHNTSKKIQYIIRLILRYSLLLYPLSNVCEHSRTIGLIK